MSFVFEKRRLCNFVNKYDATHVFGQRPLRMTVERFHFQKVLDFENWKDKVRDDGWNLKMEEYELTEDLEYEKNKCFVEMEKLTESTDPLVFQNAEVYIFMAKVYWEAHMVEKSLATLKLAMERLVISPKVLVIRVRTRERCLYFNDRKALLK